MTSEERIDVLEKQVAALKELLVKLTDTYNWHDHRYDYSRESSSYDYDASTQSTKDRVDTSDLERAFK